MSWSIRFAEPIVLEDGSKLATLRDAIRHLAQIIPKAERDMSEVLTASDLLSKRPNTTARSSSRASPRCRRSIATSSGFSTPHARKSIGAAANSRAIDEAGSRRGRSMNQG